MSCATWTCHWSAVADGLDTSGKEAKVTFTVKSDYKKRRTCSNSLGVKEELARTRIFSALQEKFSNPEALDYLRERIAQFLGESTATRHAT